MTVYRSLLALRESNSLRVLGARPWADFARAPSPDRTVRDQTLTTGLCSRLTRSTLRVYLPFGYSHHFFFLFVISCPQFHSVRSRSFENKNGEIMYLGWIPFSLFFLSERKCNSSFGERSHSDSSAPISFIYFIKSLSKRKFRQVFHFFYYSFVIPGRQTCPFGSSELNEIGVLKTFSIIILELKPARAAAWVGRWMR